MAWRLVIALLWLWLWSLELPGTFATTNLVNCTCSSEIKTIKFGQSVPLTGSNALSGTPLRDGILAAFHEFNQDTTTEDKKNLRFVLDARDDKYVASLSLQNMLSFAQDPDLFGVLGNFGTTAIELAAPIAMQHNLLFFAVYGGMSLRRPFEHRVITLRGSYFDESAAIVEYFVSQSKKRISIFAQNDAFGLSAREGMMAALDSLNLYLHSEAYYTKNMNSSVWQQEVDAAVKNMTSNLLSFRPPDAIVIAAVYEPAVIFIRRVHELWPDTDMVCLSSVNIFGLIDGLAAAKDSSVEHVYSSQFLPNPVASTDRLVERFRAAAALANVPSSNYLALESYMMGRVVIAAFQRIKESNFTQDALMDVIYRDSFFNIDGFRVGPFYPATVEGGCNQGIQGSRIVKVFLNQSIADVHTMSFSTCGYRGKLWKKLTFGQSCSFTRPKSRSTRCIAFRDGLLAAFKQINDAGGVRGTTRLLVQTRDDLGDPKVASVNNNNFIRDPEIFALIGTDFLAVDDLRRMMSSSEKMLFGAFTGDHRLREPFQRNIVNFRASSNDEVFAIVHHCYDHLKLTKVSVLFENSEYGKEHKEKLEVALREKRLSIHSGVSYSSVEQIGEAVRTLFSGARSKLQAVVFIGLDDVVAQVLQEVHKRDRNIMVFGLSDTYIAADLTVNETIAMTVNLDNFLLTSVVPHPDGFDSELSLAYTDGLANLNPLATTSVAGLEGFVVGQMLASSLSRVMAKEFTVANLLGTIYENGNYDVFGLKCGPLQHISSNVSTQRSCNQCMKSVFLTKVSGETVEGFSFDDTCMYRPVDNLSLQVGTVRLPLVVIAIGCILFTMINGILHVVLRRNAHIMARPMSAKLVTGVGALLCFSEVFVIFPVPTDTTCLLTPWIIDLSFVLLIGPIIARIIVLDRRQMTDRKKRRSRHKTNSISQMNHMLFLTATLFMVYVVFLVTFTLVDPPHMEEAFTSNGLRYEKCVNESIAFVYLDHGLMGGILLWGVLLCQRQNGSRLTEVKQLSLCIYHTTLLTMCFALLKLVTANDPTIQFICVSMTLMEYTLFLVIMLFTRPVYNALRGIPVEPPTLRRISAPMRSLLDNSKHNTMDPLISRSTWNKTRAAKLTG